jgi:hypothetical protein
MINGHLAAWFVVIWPHGRRLSGRRLHDRLSRPTGLLPATGAPLGDGRTLGAEGGVLTVARLEPGLVGQAVEELVLDVVDERGEVLHVAARVACPGPLDALHDGFT